MDRRKSFQKITGTTIGLTIPWFKFFTSKNKYIEAETPIGKMLQKLHFKNILKDKNWFIWSGSVTKDPNGLYDLLYARWPKSTTFLGWLTHSEIAVAVAKKTCGPFIHKKTALPARAQQFWDGSCTHNPHINKYRDTYYPYYMRNIGGKKITKSYHFTHRNSQRIGIVTAKHLWEIFLEICENLFVHTNFRTRKQSEWNVHKDVKDYQGHGHGGGDWRLVKNWLQTVSKKDASLLASTIYASIESHLMGFMAKKSRLNNIFAR
ncbi:hypothetical protein JL193_16520 [Polaribacter batillariae]|uniref:Uncharacterized protein n=1 Tax=Polaribacter batillariae TaxID=2808900 RepID=A0ABX7SUS4_9FLAO|nr:hypothetical protein [Polaribacter batillariae]QTD37647.1 hypothetical protein JL193_16520 [Polaribacter batillariae]